MEPGSTPIKPEPLWHVQIAVLVAVLLQLGLGEQYTLGPKYLIAILELGLMIGLVLSTPKKVEFESKLRRGLAIVLIAVISFMNAGSLLLLAEKLLKGGISNGTQLLLSALAIWLTNIIIFGLWYWEIDGGGPGKRSRRSRRVDFLYPQMSSPSYEPAHWQPTFMDYVYVSATNATAFSPTDTMPLTHRAKLLMLIQSLISLTAVALVAARAVNILR